MKKISKDTIVRTVVLAVALLNNILTMFGINPIPFSENEIYTVVSTVITVVASVWAWWKNNSFTKSAIEADEVMKELKKESKEDTKK